MIFERARGTADLASPVERRTRVAVPLRDKAAARRIR